MIDRLPPRRESPLDDRTIAQLMLPLSNQVSGRQYRFDNLHRANNKRDSWWVAELRAEDPDAGDTWVSRRSGPTPEQAVVAAVRAAIDGRVWQEADPDSYGPYKNARPSTLGDPSGDIPK